MKTPIFSPAIGFAIALSLLIGCDRRDEQKGHGHDEHAGHDHAAHAEPANKKTEKPDDHDHGHDHDEHDHGGHDDDHKDDHGTTQPATRPAADTHDKHDHDEHEGHDHSTHAGGHDEHAEHSDEVKLTSEAIARADIRVEAVKKRVISPTFTAPGRVAFNTEATAHVGTAITGRVARIDAKVGDRVKAGDALLLIDSTELGEAQSDLMVKLAAVQAAAPAVALAQTAHERAKALYAETKGISLTEVHKREADLRAAEAAALAAKAAASAAQNRLRLMGMSQESIDRVIKSGTPEPRMAILAPIAGEVIDREVTIGELVSPDKDAMLILADMSSLWVIADVPEARFAEVAVGAKASVAVTSAAGEPIAGVIAHIAPQLDPATRTASVRIDVRQAADAVTLRPGMFAQITVTSTKGSPEPVLAVPDEAIQNVEGGPAVFVPVEGEANTFAKRAIKIGTRVGEWVPVTDGLREGEKVVVSGAFLLKADLGKAGAAHEH